MLAYIFRRVLASVPVLIVVALFVFLLLRLTPGDPAAIIAGDMATPAQLEQIRQNLGLNEPLVTQFVTWSGQLLSGDFGRSLISKTPVLTLIHQRLEPTLSLAIVTMIITLLLSIPMGVVAAWRHATLTDSAIMAMEKATRRRVAGSPAKVVRTVSTSPDRAVVALVETKSEIRTQIDMISHSR